MNEASDRSGPHRVGPGSAAWDAWLAFYRSSGMEKIEARMHAVIADAMRARGKWLDALLLEILSSDRPLADVEIAEHADGRTVIAICGEPVHVFAYEVSYVVPSAMPPALPQARNLMAKPAMAPVEFARKRRSAGDGEFDAIVERLEQRGARYKAEIEEQRERRKAESRRDQILADALAAAREDRRPQVDGAEGLDVIAVGDPYEEQSLISVGCGPPMRVKNVRPKIRLRVVTLRDDPIGQLAKRGMLGKGDLRSHRLAAARCWQAYYEKAEIGGARAIEYRERVNSGSFAMPETDQRLRAQRKLRKLRDAMGALEDLRILGSRLLTWVLADKLSLNTIAEMHFGTRNNGGRNRLPLLAALCECLDIIASEVGIAPDPKQKTGPRPRRRDAFDVLARAAKNPRLYDAINEARAWSRAVAEPGNRDKPKLTRESESTGRV
jgi:hypothetical protein